MKQTIYLAITALALTFVAASCKEDTPQSLAQESIDLHEQLKKAKTEADSSDIFKKIIDVETRARALGENEYHEFANIARSADKQNGNK